MRSETSWKPAKRRRTSVSLRSKFYLRATSTATLLEGYGRRLRKTPGGIGIAQALGEDEYRKSFQVYQVDYFLSHSWQANWSLKFLTLLFYFNLIPALLFSSFIAAVVLCLRLADEWHTNSIPVWLRKQCLCLMFGISSFCIMLLSWHHILLKLPKTCTHDTIFLDKVCIHQTNMQLKEHGIKSIGGVLANSNRLLVIWDRSYFSRLWCCYEMSAYMFTKGTSQSVRVAPVALGSVAGILALYQAVLEMIWMWVLHLTNCECGWAKLFYSALYFLMCIRVDWSFREYLKAIADLDAQLATFSVRHTECFCCKSNHINPMTGDRLPCDREVVYNSIVHWQKAENVEQGLRDFDNMIRGSFKEFVGKVLRTAAPIPYRVSLITGTISMFAYADYHLFNLKQGTLTWRTIVIMFVNLANCQFLYMPLHAGILMLTLKRTCYSDTCIGRCYEHFFSAALCAVCLFVTGTIKDKQSVSDNVWATAAMVIFEIIGVWYLFFAVPAKHQTHHVVRDPQDKPAIELRSFFSESRPSASIIA